MNNPITSQEFHLPLAQITQPPLDCTLRYLNFEGHYARLGLEYSHSEPFAGMARCAFSPMAAAPAAVRAPWCITLLSASPRLSQLQRLLQFFAEQQWTVTAVDTLSQSLTRTVIRFQIDGKVELSTARNACLQMADTLGADLVLQSGASQKVPALAGFDMDSTLIDAEVIDELAKITGVEDQVAAITQAAMSGDLDFCESFKRRMALLKGFSEQSLAEIAPQLPLKTGAHKLLNNLRALGCKTAILTGGFSYFAHYLQRERLPVDFVYANEMVFSGGVLTGGVVEPIVDGLCKRALLQAKAQELKLGPESVVAMGDGANDLPMLHLGALGIAIHPKPKVRLEAPQVINLFGLDAALYLFGLNDRQIEKLAS
ncbi:phosphoserine phosphatase SerB [Microbulbifer sp. 2205BS26-8]|uniref:phosphoserine phosphatase SerB n=1 Tax=Microbulbifer sp. 2205BS26-8 TaxID=3064386 RepID=UPI00273ED32E|nr:phosphoserine phosphatase SerB [Microbulbifer sp. 2205BS26-8]MDP5210429.1 phosphoserine phosphatase SerB [Microbulbifer sp. 2205BS26-8]